MALSDQAECCLHAAAQARPASDGYRAGPAGADLAEQVCHLYLCQELSTASTTALSCAPRTSPFLRRWRAHIAQPRTEGGVPYGL